MGFTVRNGKIGFGCEVELVHGALINRAAGVSIAYEPLMCDLANTAYTADADSGGVLGNGITPAADGTWGGNIYFAPVGIVQKAGVAVGSQVPVFFQGKTSVLINNGAAVTRGHITYSANRYCGIGTGAVTANLRALGWTNAAHGGTGTEAIACTFLGLDNAR